MSRDSALWIGGVEKYMTEEFLRDAFSLMGEDSVVSVKVIKNKFTGEPATYGFIHFDSDAAALMAMHKLNNKIIPNSQPPVRFQLNHASAKHNGGQFTEREYSIWVSDLPETITEDEFKKSFASRFESLKTAKLFKEKDNKVYGFVRFTDLNDQRDALIHMNGFLGLGKKPIKVTLAIPKRSLAEATNKISTTYSDMYESYWNDNSAMTNYGAYQASSSRAILVSSNSTMDTNSWDMFEKDSDEDEADEDDDKDEDRLIDHSTPLNIDAMNTDYINKSNEVWDSMEKDRWLYNLDGEVGILPDFRKKSKSAMPDYTQQEEDE